MTTLQDTTFWLLFIVHAAVVIAGFAYEWRKGCVISDELARRAGVGP